MVHSLILPQETIASIQEQIEILERCLNDANVQDEATAELLELANSRQISLDEIREEMRQLQYKFNKFIKLVEGVRRKSEQGEDAVLLFVRANFLLKEIADQYWDFFLNKDGKIFIQNLTFGSIYLYREFQLETDSGTHKKDDNYIIVETLKHVIQSLIKASLRVNALSKEEIEALDLGDITPQESEAVLTFLSSKKKWDWVYRNLA